MSDRPKRALLSLKSVGVICFVLSVFVWANIVERSFGTDTPRELGTVELLQSGRGFPLTYHLENRACFYLDRSGNVVRGAEFPPEGFKVGETHNLLLNLAVAFAVSVALALASERFVFSRWRREREAGHE